MIAMRAGIRDIAEPGRERPRHSFRVLLERRLPVHGQASPPVGEGRRTVNVGRVVAVMSPKGGVGKTTVATNLAVGLAKTAPMGVVIVDLDLQFGDVASALNVDPEHTITDAVFGRERPRTPWSSRPS